VSPEPEPLRILNREFSSNTYLCPVGEGRCLLVDPGFDAEEIEAAVSASGLKVTAVFCTHGHFDHIASAERFRRQLAVPVYLHEADRRIARDSNFLLMALKSRSRIVVPDEFTALGEGSIEVPERVEVLHVPGHTPGSVVLRVGRAAFTGDTLFSGDVWFGALPGEDRPALLASLKRLWEMLPDDTIVHPGHGPVTGFAEIKRTNEALRNAVGLPETARP
jgi:hydroxyacylglutathione hydrolase